MLSSLRTRLQKDEDGFTLIELMVVVLIIAILLAIAIPTFLGAQDRAQARGVQSNLRNSMTAAKTIATDDAGLFTNVTEAELDLTEGAIEHIDGGGATPTAGQVAVEVNAAGTLLNLWGQTEDGDWFGIAVNSSGETGFCEGATNGAAGEAEVDDSGTGCAVGADEW